MPEEPEIDTNELHETLEELQEERKEREESERRAAWTRYIALTTAFLAVFAAIGALQSGSLVNEAMVDQLKASDKWNEYQSDRQKDHLYTVQANQLLDQGVSAPAKARPAETGAPANSARPARKTAPAEAPARRVSEWRAKSASERLKEYMEQVDKEADKERDLSSEARKLEEESGHRMHKHHQFALSVAFIQVAIALSAVAALTRMKWIWVFSIVVGLAGVVLFALGFA